MQKNANRFKVHFENQLCCFQMIPHAIKRITERNISLEEIKHLIEFGSPKKQLRDRISITYSREYLYMLDLKSIKQRQQKNIEVILSLETIHSQVDYKIITALRKSKDRKRR